MNTKVFLFIAAGFTPSQSAIVDMGADEYCVLKKTKFVAR